MYRNNLYFDSVTDYANFPATISIIFSAILLFSDETFLIDKLRVVHKAFS